MADAEPVDAYLAESVDESGCQAGIRDEGDVEVDSGSADKVSVFQLTLRVVLGNVDDEIYPLVFQIVKHVGLLG